ncbi:MAG: hypothetical protein M1813_008605 [Trichoglossum hirsutum]|nr:MAG: hypothetical protein M1813_008605 [Trichoglossum hirsutum]
MLFSPIAVAFLCWGLASALPAAVPAAAPQPIPADTSIHAEAIPVARSAEAITAPEFKAPVERDVSEEIMRRDDGSGGCAVM